MTVLLLNQAFHPDVVASGQYLMEIALRLVERGHEVTVVTNRRAYDHPERLFPLRLVGSDRGRWRRKRPVPESRRLAGSFDLAWSACGTHVCGVTALQQRDAARRQRRLELCAATRALLRAALASLISGHKVIVFGSLTQPTRFNDRSDIDLALESEPSGTTVWRLTSELMERLDRPVDVVLLDQFRFHDKILREGEVWIA
jgi:predicted nucleotidyltransferase